jgi:branched-chain amino acid aminotransferase
MRQVWWNGKIIPESEARISIYDSAFMFADVCFEMCRSFNKEHFKLDDHMGRLIKSARMLRIPLDMSVLELIHICNEITDVNKDEFTDDDEYRLMIDVTRGLLPRYKSVGELGTNVIVSVFPLRWATEGLGKYFDTGIPCFTPSQRQIPAHLLDPKIKHRSRLHFRMALNEGDWPLLLDPDGFISEGPGYNFFIVKQGLVTSTEPRNILRGISREYIYEIYDFVEENIEPYDVYDADEAFITGTPFCMLPVTSLNGIQIGDGKPGMMYGALLDMWSNSVGVDIKKQIQGWDNE